MQRLFSPRVLLVPAIAAALLVVAACGNDDGNDATPTPEPNGNGNGDVVTEITIDMHDNYFEPDTFTVRVGDTVTVTVENVGAAVHNMVIQSQAAEGSNFSSDPLVQAGQSDTFEFTFTTAGTYDFQCDYHLPEMVGTVTVIE